MKRNKHAEEILSKLFLKHCCKYCPNPKLDKVKGIVSKVCYKPGMTMTDIRSL